MNAGTQREARARRHRRFAGVDGEGGTMTPPGALFGESHEYLLLRAGDHVLKTGRPLSSLECLAFIADLPRDREHVAYFFDYDSTMILRGLPPQVVKQLFAKQNVLAGTRWRNFEFRYIPHKELAVRRLNPDGTPQTRDYGTVSDMGPFWQSSFCSYIDKDRPQLGRKGALEDWEIGTVEQREAICRGKAKRADFGELSQETEEYNKLECELLEQLAEKFADTCEDVGYVPKRWQGPGWLASAMLKAHDAVKLSEMPILANDYFRKLANACYYGGRFETYMVGPVPGPVYEYDINSAYPFAMTKLPCMRHGSWVKVKDTRELDPDGLWFGEVQFTHAPDARICNLPVRTKAGGLVFPLAGQGVYWSVELAAASRAGTSYVITGDCYRYVNTRCRCRPFEWVPGEYAKRKTLGGLRGKVIKLALNSLYGKLAQSVGRPTYANPVHASLITAHTRAMLIDAYRQAPDDIVMVATDAVYSRVPLELDCGPGLGQWERVVHDTGVFVVMPGVYFSDDETHSKTRGIAQATFNRYRDRFRVAFPEYLAGRKPTVPIEVTVFVTLKQAHAWGKYQLAGQWLTQTRQVSMDWALKRRGERAQADPAGFIRTLPLEGGEESVPYSKAIGGLYEQERLMYDGQPDFGDWFQHS